MTSHFRLCWTTCLLLPIVSAFQFSYSAPKSCDPLNITWTGGTPPFYLLVTPPFGTPRNVSIPNTAWEDSKGFFSMPLLLRPGQPMLLTMSDSTGFATGGNSDILVAGSSATNAQCNLTDPGVDFRFQLNSNMQQCRLFNISDYDGAQQPVHIFGMIPLGSSFELDPPNGSTVYPWRVNIRQGTSVLLLMRDAEGRNGGASDVLHVGNSDDDSCIDENSPSSTITSPPTSSPSSPSATPPPAKNKKNIGGIIGGCIAAVVVIAIAIVLFLFLRRRKTSKPLSTFHNFHLRKKGDSTYPKRSVDLGESTPNLNTEVPRLPPPDPYILSPPLAYNPQHTTTVYTPTHSRGPSLQHGGSLEGSQVNPITAPASSLAEVLPLRSPSASTNISSKAVMAGTSGPPAPRFILHTDAGSIDNLDAPGNEDVVELPPTYNAARASAVNQATEAASPSVGDSHPAPPEAHAPN